MKMKAKCGNCGGMYNLGKEFTEKDKDKNFRELIKRKYGSLKLICPRCEKTMKFEKGDLSSDDLRIIRYALNESLDFFREDKKHQKEHKNSKCHRCVDYKALQKKISRYVPD